MSQISLTGLVAAAHTPLTDEGALALDRVEVQAAHFLDHGVASVFIAGTTGESHSLTADERRQLAGRWLEVARGTRLQVIVHVGSNCVADAKALASHAQRVGAAAIAALAPSYFKPATVEALVATCAEIAGSAPGVPFYYYDVPALTGVTLPMAEFLARGRERIPGLAGIKWTNPDLLSYQICLHSPGGFDLPWGNDESLLAALAIGARGAVGSTYCFAAPIYHRLLKAFAEGDLEAARVEQFRSVRLVQLLARYGYLGAAKSLMSMLGVDVGPARLPNATLTREQEAALRAELEKLGFFEWIA